MAKKKPRKRIPQKRKRNPAPASTEMLEEIVARPMPVAQDAPDIAADHLDAGRAALDEGDLQTAVRRAQDAVNACPRHVESLEFYAELASEDSMQLVAALRVVLRIAREELGERAFTEDRGHFWGRVETRPYMQLKMRIVSLLQVLEATEEAIAQSEDMLSLNPDDNQGVREPLLGNYLVAGNLDRADELMNYYGEDSAMMLWARVLWHLLGGETGEVAEAALEAARANNVFVAPLLLGAFEMPARLPLAFTPGGPNEAVIAADCLLDAWWQKDRAPLEWLIERVYL